MFSSREYRSSLTFFIKPLVWIVILTLFFVGIFLFVYQHWTIDFHRHVDIQHRQNLIQLVSLARSAIDPILQQVHSGILSTEEALKQVRELVRHMTYEDQYGKNYIFMSAYDGNMLVQPFEPDMEMTSQWNLKDDQGFPIIQGLIKAAKEHPEGSFVQYNYHLPGVHENQQKEAYVVGLPELNCYIGTGMYMQKAIQEQKAILNKIKNGSMALSIMVLIPVLALAMIILQRNRLLEKEIQIRHQTEHALRESEERYRSIVETATEGIWSMNEWYLITFVNPQLARMLGYTVDEMIGKPADSFLFPEDISSHTRMMELRQKGTDSRYERRFRHRDGRELWMMVSAKSVMNDNQGFTGSFAMFTDITERKRALEALRESERRMQTLIGNLPGMVYRCLNEPDWPMEFVSAGALDLTGYEPGEITTGGTISYGQIIHPDDRLKVGNAVAECVRTGRPFTVEYRIRCKNDKEKWVWEQGQAVPSKEENRPRLEGFITDITARKQAEKERLEMERRLFHAQKLESLGVLAGGIAHDFNNLLMAIMGNLNMAQMNLPPASPVQESLNDALKAVYRAADLVRQMLAYSGQGQFEIRKVNINELVRGMADLLQTSIAKAIQFDIRLNDRLPLIQADPAQIQQVVMNLAINACEAIGDRSGSIVLTTGVDEFDDIFLNASRLEEKPQPGRFVYLEVTDTGCGMDEQTLRRLFDPFFTTKFQGRGLGMSAVMGIVRSLAGAIHVTSGIGYGTTFLILFPIREESLNEIAPRPLT